MSFRVEYRRPGGTSMFQRNVRFHVEIASAAAPHHQDNITTVAGPGVYCISFTLISGDNLSPPPFTHMHTYILCMFTTPLSKNTITCLIFFIVCLVYDTVVLACDYLFDAFCFVCFRHIIGAYDYLYDIFCFVCLMILLTEHTITCLMSLFVSQQCYQNVHLLV